MPSLTNICEIEEFGIQKRVQQYSPWVVLTVALSVGNKTNKQKRIK